jgi:hypothetical protein
MLSEFRTPYDRAMARRRRARALAWCVFLLLIVLPFAARILLH